MLYIAQCTDVGETVLRISKQHITKQFDRQNNSKRTCDMAFAELKAANQKCNKIYKDYN